MNKKQKGFAVLELLLILVIIGLIGGTGYYVWHSKNQTDKNLNNASTSSQNTSVKTTVNSKSIPTKLLMIKEWGVKASYMGSVDLTYKLTSDSKGEVWAQMSSVQLKKADPDCNEQSQLGGIIIRMHSGDDLLSPSGDDTGQTIESAVSSGVVSEYSHVGQYYYFYEHPQAACGDTDASSNAQSTTLDAVKEAARSLVAS